MVAMCFDFDSRPPVVPISGGSLDSSRLILTAADGNRLAAFQARASKPSGAAILILPDVRGLNPFYEELALRFAERGVNALAIDYFGRSAGTEPRDAQFEFMPHVELTTNAGTEMDIRAGMDWLRSDGGQVVANCFTIGFCFGGRLSFLAATMGLDLTGVIGFYGRLRAANPQGSASPIDVAAAMRGSVLAIFGGADSAVPAEDVAAFDEALEVAGVDHRVISYAGAPHSFFDRKAAEYAEISAASWAETLRFIEERTGSPV